MWGGGTRFPNAKRLSANDVRTNESALSKSPKNWMYRNVQWSCNSPGEGSLGSWSDPDPARGKQTTGLELPATARGELQEGTGHAKSETAFNRRTCACPSWGRGWGTGVPAKTPYWRSVSGMGGKEPPRGSATATGWAMNSDTGKEKQMVCRAGWTEVRSLTLGCRAFSGKRSPTRAMSLLKAYPPDRGGNGGRDTARRSWEHRASPSLFKRHLFSPGAPSAAGPETLGQSPRSLLRGGQAPASFPWPGGSVPAPAGPGIGCLSQLRFSSGAPRSTAFPLMLSRILNLFPPNQLGFVNFYAVICWGTMRGHRIRWYSDKLTPAFVFQPL